MTKAPYWPVATDALIADTTHLTAEEFGAYVLLMMAQWRSGGEPLPADEKRLAMMCRLTGKSWAKVREAIAPLFEISDAGWSQKRVAKDHLTVSEKIDKNKHSGSLGGKAKALKNKEAGVANATNSPPEKSSESLPTINQNYKLEDSEEGKPSSGAGAKLKSDRPPWWPKQDKYGRVISDVTEKIVFDVGKAVLGKSAGGQVTRLRKLYRGDMRAVTDILLQAEEKSDPAEWIAGVIKRGDVDEITPTKSEIYPEFAY